MSELSGLTMLTSTHGSYTIVMMRSDYRFIGLLLVAALVALTPVAHATPPDPTYISGLWDDADYDDIVNLATSASSIIGAQARYELVLVHLDSAVPPAVDVLIASCPLCLTSRAPPTS